LLGLEFVAGGALVATGAAIQSMQDRRMQQFLLEERTVEQNELKMQQYGFTGRHCTNVKFMQVVSQSPEAFAKVIQQHDFAALPEIQRFLMDVFQHSLSLRPCDPPIQRELTQALQNPGRDASGYCVVMAVKAVDPPEKDTTKSPLEGKTKEEVRDDMIMSLGDRYKAVADEFYSFGVDGKFAAQGFSEDELENDFSVGNRMMRRALLSHLDRYVGKTSLETATKEEVMAELISSMGDKYTQVAKEMCSLGVDGAFLAKGLTHEDLADDWHIDDVTMRKALLSHFGRYRPKGLCMVGITASRILFDHVEGWTGNNALPLALVKSTMLSLMAQDSLQKSQPEPALEDDDVQLKPSPALADAAPAAKAP